eukprot:CAMPEP_0117743416 /NCGR_PEP_ID=MMETSP0947-20121206/6120_1 /TAXON_ID=44440 /ORGANISM="Chattonella subsalsa, Strain CCMP2191" /LENGTH=173 /DNA_ID=CAMNT_0005560109 /DNA_START=100 /DNA_END=621 /DNA_ORIENTATION=-
MAPGEDMTFVMDPPPDHYSIQQRIERWAKVISLHPILNKFDAKQFVEDLPETFIADLARARPIIERYMEIYKQSDERKEIEDTLQLNEEGREQILKDCDIAIDYFFSGNWGCIKLFEFILLNNAFQMSDPSDFEEDERKMLYRVFTVISTIMESFRTLGIKNLDHQLEDFRAM